MADQQATSDKFSQYVDNVVRNGCVTMGLAIGVKLGLFESMAKLGKPASVDEIAELTQTKSSVLRQWLLMMSAADIINMTDADGKEFFLPPSRRDALTSQLSRVVSSSKYAVMFSGFAFNVATFLKKNGSAEAVKTSAMDLFALWQNDRTRVFKSIMPGVIPQVPGLAARLEKGCQILDVGCGKGDLAFVLAELYPKTTIVGIDPGKDQVTQAKERATADSVSNVSFHVEDAMCLPSEWSDKFDYALTVNALHHFPDPVKGCREIRRVLASEGRASLLEIREDGDARQNVQQPGAVMYYAFNTFMAGLGDEDEASGESEGSHHDGPTSFQTHMKSIQDGGFSNVEMFEAPTADFLDQVHLLATK